MGMKNYNEDRKAPNGNLIFEHNQTVAGLQQSPRDARGRLIETELNLATQARFNGSYPIMNITDPKTGVLYYTRSAFPAGQALLEGKLPGTSFPAWLETEALISAYDKMYKKVANVADIIRTRRETQNMVINSIRRLTSAARAIRHGNIHRASSILGSDLHKRPRGGTMPERWLEYSYGWAPLLSDCYEILNKGFGDIELEFKSKKILNSEFVQPLTWSTGGSPWSHYQGSLFETHVASCKLKCTLPNTSVQPISAWGLDNPLELAWEALPYSFVIDWFLPIGDYLAQCGSFASTVKVTQMSITKKTSRDWVGSTLISTQPNNSAGAMKSSRVGFSRQYTYKTRSNQMRSRPLPRLQTPFTSPSRYLNQLSLFQVELQRRVIK